MTDPNLVAGWTGILLGFLAGAIPGMFFHVPDWLGGYSSWPRRMVRLAHIAFFGLGFINILFSLTVGNPGPSLQSPLGIASLGLILGAATMPLVCYLSAWRPSFRNLFFIPVLCLVFGVGGLLYSGVLWGSPLTGSLQESRAARPAILCAKNDGQTGMSILPEVTCP
jgi:hypothetical protein